MGEEVEIAAARKEAKAAALLPPVYTAEEAARKQELPIEPGALVLYLLFVVTFTVVAVSTRDWRFGYRYGEAMKSTLLETEFDTADTEIYKTFHDVTTLTDVWWYLQGPLIGALYSETSYTGQPLPPERLRFVNDNNKLLGKVRLQQVRVAPNVGCRVADWAASNSSAAYVSECYPEGRKCGSRATTARRSSSTPEGRRSARRPTAPTATSRRSRARRRRTSG